MERTTNSAGKGVERTEATAKAPAPLDERPPESAEDFQHVLRRLIAAREATNAMDRK